MANKLNENSCENKIISDSMWVEPTRASEHSSHAQAPPRVSDVVAMHEHILNAESLHEFITCQRQAEAPQTHLKIDSWHPV